MSIFSGSIVAIVTPMNEDGLIDFNSFYKFIDWQIINGTKAIVVGGTTGESSTLSIEEHVLLVKSAVNHVKNRIPIIAGSGGNSTYEVIELTKKMQDVGANATLQVVPYYNKPSQSGIYYHFKKIAETVDIPLILYNVPSRTSVDMSNTTTLRLSKIPGIIGIKDSTGNIDRVSKLINSIDSKFYVFSGDDFMTLKIMLLGGHGSISVIANIFPYLINKLCESIENLDIKTAKLIDLNLLPLYKSIFIESNPIPVKWALKELGYIENGIRLPLTALNVKYHKMIKFALNKVKIFNTFLQESERISSN